MNFFFRVDASSQIGNGHVMRCLTLAKVLKKQGADCKFVSRDHKNNLIEKIKEENFKVITLPNSIKVKSTQSAKNVNLNYTNWIGASWKKDAKQTIDALNKEKIDWLIVDHYGIDERWEKKLRPYVGKIMVIDDLANRNHDCDLLLDQNLIANFKSRYQNLLPKNCSTLLGPEYALLQNEYKKLHLSAPPRIGQVKHILVYFGGADKNNLTEIILFSYLKLNSKNIKLDVVINSKNPQKEKIKKLSKKNKNIKIYSDLTSLASLMLKADLAIGACGVTSWERCCLCLPSIVITIADNQKPIAEELHRQGIVRWLGHYDKITNNSIYNELKIVIDQKLETWSNVCKSVTDGYGAERVASILTLNSKTKLKPRLAELKDENLLQNFSEFSTIKKSKDIFHKSFYSYLRNQDKSKVYILETEEGFPICQVQFNLTKVGWTIDCTQAKFVRNLRLERYFIESALYKFKLDQNSPIIFTGRIKNNKKLKRKLSISICSKKTSWINSSISSLIFGWINQGHSCSWVHDDDHLIKGDLCFYLGYEKIVRKEIRKKFRNNLVIHESDLPKGKGWSPLSWQILEGKKKIPFSLIEAGDKVDSGVIYSKKWKNLNNYELLQELHSIQAKTTNQLCRWFVKSYPQSCQKAKKQVGESSKYRRRLPKDSKLDINKSIKDQFNLLRIIDNESYPAYFEIDGHAYQLKIKTTN
jgi:UDP-2,4-diacetamido-2,4,6-trideoxy-beta-L-altropyranose hydrolase